MAPRSLSRHVVLAAGLLAAPASPTGAQFQDRTAAVGLDESFLTWGASLTDLDGDGWLDVYSGHHFVDPSIFVNLGGTFALVPPPFTGLKDRHGALILRLDDDDLPEILIVHGASGGAGSQENELYRNDGALTWSLVPGAAGMEEPTARGRTISAADWNGDGRIDIWFGNAPRATDPNSLFRNDSTLVFTDVSAAVGLDEELGTVGGIWTDYDNDSDQDLFVGGEEFGRPSVLWRNDGGTFADASAAFLPALPVVSGADWGDLDEDGDQDLAVCDGGIGLFDVWAEDDSVTFYFNTRHSEDGVDGLTVPSSADTVWAGLRYRGAGDRTVVFLGPTAVNPASAWEMALTDEYVGEPAFTAGQDIGFFVWRTAPGGDWEIRCSTPSQNADTFDGWLWDGTLITGVADSSLEISGFTPGGPRVWRNDSGTFREVTAALGLPGMLNPRDISWVDFDNDGDLDLHVVDLGTSAAPNAPDLLLRNDGSAFTDVTALEGVAGGSQGMGDGGVWGDLDEDGDLDLYLQQSAGPAVFARSGSSLYLRNEGQRGGSVQLTLTGSASGRPAVGARVCGYAGGLSVHRRVSANSWRGFQDPLRTHLGLAGAARADSVVVEWPAGATQVFPRVFPGSYAVHESDTPLHSDVSVSVAVDDPLPGPGDPVTYTVVVTNLGPDAAAGVQVTDVLPAGTSFQGAVATSGGYDDVTGVWSAGALAVGVPDTLALTATADSGSGGLSLVNTARLTRLAIQTADLAPGNDADSISITVQAVLAISSAADQLLAVGSPPVPILPITVTDDAASARITAGNDVRIRIPSGLPMSFDVTDGTAQLSGPAAGKVSSAVSYEAAGAVLVLDVTADFSPNDRLTVSGLAFADFLADGGPDRLELEVDNDGMVSALDDRSIEVSSGTSAAVGGRAPAWRLGRAFPNPFRTSTTIAFELPTAGGIGLRVYDVAGRLVKVLRSGSHGAGGHTVVWDGTDRTGRRVGAGVYFYRLEASELRRTRKVMRAP